MADIEYLHCPLCGWNRPLNTKDYGERRFEVKPEFDVIELRRGGGRGSGFVRLEGAGSSIADLPRRNPELYRNLLEETQKLLSALQDAGRT